jgi:hypothetical protein
MSVMVKGPALRFAIGRASRQQAGITDHAWGLDELFGIAQE